MNQSIKYIIIGAIVAIALLILASIVHANTEHDKGLHAECQINQSGQDCQEGLICTPFNEKSGNGKCEYPNPTVTPTNSPTPKISCTPTPTPHITCEGEDCITPSPSIEVTPTSTPSPTLIPTETVAPTQGSTPPGGDSPHPDNPNDGRSDGGRSSDFNHTSHYDHQVVGWK